MKAVVYTAYGAPSVLQLKEVDKPVPKPNEVLVKVCASTVTSGTIWIRKGIYPESKVLTFFLRLMFGIAKPRKSILGFEFSGVVENIGKDVKKFSIGDSVYGTTTGLKQGAYAHYVCVPEKWSQGVIALKPKGLTFNEAAALPIGSITALQILRKARIEKQHTVLIYGASGSVGTYAVQLAKYFNCKVIAACSTKNIELVKSIGADEVIDYTQTEITQHKNSFDRVIDAVGKLPSATLKSITKKGGNYVSVKTITNEKVEHLDFVEQVIKEGKLKPVIDKVYPLDKIVEANEYVDLGHKRGNVIINIAPPTNNTVLLKNRKTYSVY